MALAFGGQGLGTLRTGAVVKPTPVASKQAAPNKTTAAKQTVLKQTTPVKAVVTPDPYAKALAAQPSLATLLAQASTQANTLAQQQVNAQVQAIQQQQAQAHATAAAQAAEINKASLAAAQFLTPLGDQAAGDYTAAVQNLGGLVGGYTGGLRDTAQAAQDAAQAQLAGISGNTQTVEGQGANLANLLYGVSGSIPANALATQGLGATALARAIPQQELSYGQQQAIGQIGAGNTAADALNTQLASARGQLPTLTSQYLTQFQTSARDVANQAHQRLMDANTLRNTTSEIAARAATTKANALKNAPHIDISQSKLTGVLTDQFSHPITKNVGGKKFLQTLPGFHFDNTGQVVADPKPVTLEQQSARAAEWTRVNHYRSDWQGNPLNGKITPTGGWVVSPDGQSAVPPAKPGKAFVPKIDKVMSAADHVVTYWDTNTGQWVQPKDAKTGQPIPYDPNKPAALKLFNSGGQAAVFDPNTNTSYKLTDDNKVPLPWGTPKAPPATHLSGRYAGADGFWHVYNTSTGADVNLGTKVPPKAAAAGSWQKITDPKTGQITFYNPTTQARQNTPFTESVPGQAVGTYTSIKGTDGKLWRINSVTNKTVKTNIPWPTSASKGSLSAEAVQNYTSRINALLGAAKSGIPADPNKGTPAHPPVALRSEAIEQLKAAGYFTRALKPMALAILDAYYPRPGAVGKSWFSVTDPALSGG